MEISCSGFMTYRNQEAAVFLQGSQETQEGHTGDEYTDDEKCARHVHDG